MITIYHNAFYIRKSKNNNLIHPAAILARHTMKAVAAENKNRVALKKS